MEHYPIYIIYFLRTSIAIYLYGKKKQFSFNRFIYFEKEKPASNRFLFSKLGHLFLFPIVSPRKSDSYKRCVVYVIHSIMCCF